MPKAICLLHVLDRSLSGGEAGDGDTERAAGDIVQADLVAELDGRGIAAVLCPWAFTTRVSVRSVPPPLKALPS